MEAGEGEEDAVLKRLREALEEQRRYLAAYEQPSEPLAYETLRTLDDLFCRDLMEPARPVDESERRLRSLSTWGVNQKHMAFAAILRARHRSVHIRNLLTTHGSRQAFIEGLARYMDAEYDEIECILTSFILTGDNIEVHTKGSEIAWAPIVQASRGTLLLPTYGLDINPFLFLLSDVRARYERDWFRIANNRERRWIEDLKSLFDGPRWQTHCGNARLREAGRDVTDIDFAVLDKKTNEVALFQLKWQHPVGMDHRGRRSSGRNLVVEGNRWVEVVLSWLDRYGGDELRRRLRFDGSGSPTIHLFVLGRYHVHLTGFDSHDTRAVWSDWAHFQRVRLEGHRRSVSQTARALRSLVARSRANKTGESIMFPVGGIGLVLNPRAVPEGTGSTP